MRVLHVLPSLSATLGGPTEVALQLVRGLNKLGIYAEIATTNDDQSGTVAAPLGRVTSFRDAPVWFFPRAMLRRKEFIPSLPFAAWLAQSVANYDIVDIHYLFTFSSTVAGWAARRKHVPYTVRTMGQLAAWSLSQRSLLKHCYAAAFDRRLLNRAAAIHCTSDLEARDVENFGVVAPRLVIPLGVERTSLLPEASRQLRERFAIPLSAPIVLFFSRMHEKKRPELLIESLAKLRDARCPHLILAGSGAPEYIDKLRHLVGAHGLKDRVHFAGFVGPEDRSLFLQGCDLFVLPTYSDNFALAVAEALEAGAAVVTTSGVQIAPTISQYQAGLILEPGDDQLPAAIDRLLGDESLRREMGRRARCLAHEHYSWDTAVLQLAHFYRGLLSVKHFVAN